MAGGAWPRIVVAAVLPSLLLAVSACGDFIELEPPRQLQPPRFDAGTRPPVGDGPAVERAFYSDCADALAMAPSVDPTGYGAVLARRVTTDDAGFALVDYVGWSQDAGDTAVLEDYLDALGSAEPRACELDFWINAYNANVLHGVLGAFGGDRGYSVADDDFAFFTASRVPVAGLMLSLDELEHGVVRGDWTHASVEGAPMRDALMQAHDRLWGGARLDARIHMALNCAARGCPNLRDAPYAGAELDAQLEAAARAFLDNGDKGAGAQGVTQLFEWFRGDFEADSGSLDDFIRLHRSDGLAGVDRGRFIAYDWSLNTQ